MIDDNKTKNNVGNKTKKFALFLRKNHNISVVPAQTQKKGGPPFSWKQFQEEPPSIEQIKNWWDEHKDMGIAVITGKVSNVLVLDIDPRHGGNETIKTKEIPPTWTVKTGGGGTHYYFSYPDSWNKIKNFTGEHTKLQGVDLRADGGMAFAPPSLHPSGNRYQFKEGLAPWEVELSDPPEWLMKVIKKQNQKNKSKNKNKKIWSEKWSGVISGNRNNTCAQLAGKLAHSGMPEELAIETLKVWNQGNTDQNGKPNPLKDSEIEKTVSNIYRLHNQNDNEKEIDDFIPSKLSKMLYKHLKNKKGTLWAYVPEMEIFYYYSSDEGYWRKNNASYLRSEIRDLLGRINPKWESKRSIDEILSAFKHQTQNESYSKIFTGESKKKLKHINLKNGMLDWKNKELKQHKPGFFSRYHLPVEYDPNAKCPNWQKALKDWIPGQDTRKFLQEFIGYSLLPDTSMQIALFLLGSGANGKSTFLDVIMELFGEENMSSIPLNRLTGRFETANLQSKLVNICSDIDPVYLKQTGLVKMIIAGDKIRGEHKYRDSFEFRPVARLIFSSNELPTSSDKTDGWYRRLKIVEFPNKFSKEDGSAIPNLKKQLLSELPGIFLWALEGLIRFKKQGQFTTSEAVEKAKKRYEAENDSVASFAMERLEQKNIDEPKFVLPKKYLYRKYENFCDEFGLKGVGRRKMVQRLKKMGFEQGRRRSHKFNTCSESPKKEESFLEALDAHSNNWKNTKKPLRCFVRTEYQKES